MEGKEKKFPMLRGRIVEKYGTIGEFANVLGTHINVVSRKLSGSAGFSLKDMEHWCALLDIPRRDMGIFFTE